MRLTSQEYCDNAWGLVEEYITGVTDGSIICGKWIKLAVQRYKRMLNDPRFFYRVEKVDRLFKFFSYINIENKNTYVQMPLLSWQAFTLAFVFGFYEADNHEKRVIRELFCFVARKSGKTAFASSILLYGMLGDGVINPTSLLLANTTQQASVCLNYAKDIINHSPDLFKRLKIHRNKIVFADDRKQGFAQIFSTIESTRLEGYGSSLTIADEIHAWPNANVMNAIRTGQGARLNPLIISISTAGSNEFGFCKEYLLRHQNTLEGNINDEHILGMLYMPDSTDDLSNPEIWIKSNPSLHVVNSLEDLKIQFEQSKYSYADKYFFLTKNLNIFLDSADVWIPQDDLAPHFKKLNIEDYYGRDVYIGVDLSSTVDLTGIVLLFTPTEDDPMYTAYPIFYMADRPNNMIRKNGKDLSPWIKRGHIIKCDGKVIDLDQIYEKLIELSTKFNIISISYDKYNSPQLIARLQEQGISCNNIEQNARRFNAPMKIIETYVYEDKIQFFDNPCLLYMFSNVVIYIDSNNNIKPMKNRNNDSTDGVVALAMAVAGFIDSKYGIELIGLKQYLNGSN